MARKIGSHSTATQITKRTSGRTRRSFRILAIGALALSILSQTSWFVLAGRTVPAGKRQLQAELTLLNEKVDQLRVDCATDPTYKYFEAIQRTAYQSSPITREMWQNVEALKRSLKENDKELRQRPNSLGSGSPVTDKDSDRITNAVLSQKLPTCYENPLIYYMLNEYVKRIELARKQLGFSLNLPPKFGSLPTADINAYTYPATTVRDSVIAFNTQLFMFAYQMTKVTMPTISVSNDTRTKRVEVDLSLDGAKRSIERNGDLKTNFAMALLEFLLLVDPSTEPLDQAYDAVLINFTEGMEMFAVAHEYGHVIKAHSIVRTKQMQLFSEEVTDTPASATVVLRSWQQELEADQVGLQLVIQALRHPADGDPVTNKRWLYSVYGALFFFKCMDMIDNAKYIRDQGQAMPLRSPAEEEYIRAVADGRVTADQHKKYDSLKLEDHPPAWLRLERVRKALDDYLKRESIDQETKDFSRIGMGLISNIDVLWESCLPRLPVIIQAVRQQRMKKGR